MLHKCFSPELSPSSVSSCKKDKIRGLGKENAVERPLWKPDPAGLLGLRSSRKSVEDGGIVEGHVEIHHK